MLHLLKTIENEFEMTIRNYCRGAINWMVMLNHLPTDCSLLPATFQDLRLGIKFMFSSKIEVSDGDEGLNPSLGSSTHNNLFAFVCLQNITFCQ
jgi:hypothetical protein